MATVDPRTEAPPPPPAPASVSERTHPLVDEPPVQAPYEEPVERESEEPVAAPGEDPHDATTLPPIVDPEGELEALEDRSMPIERLLWAINDKGERKEAVYVQKGLSWFGKLELYGLLGQAVKIVLEGDSPLGVSSLLGFAQSPRQMVNDLMGGLPGADTAPDRQQSEENQEIEAGKILSAFAQVVSIAPELLEQAYCVVLGIPKTWRNWAINWAFPNMDDEMGKDILHTFVDQNWGVMEDFFGRELPKIMKRVVKARASAGPR
jgi:hypothetical protein